MANMFGIENPRGGSSYWGGSDARSGNYPYGWSAPLWVTGNVSVGATLAADQKARLGVKIPGDLNWSGGDTDMVGICYSVGGLIGKGQSVSGVTVWLSGYACTHKSTGPLFSNKQSFSLDPDTPLSCGSFTVDVGEGWQTCDYVMVTLDILDSNFTGYLHMSYSLSTWRNNLNAPI